jgi:hypothetical protein
MTGVGCYPGSFNPPTVAHLAIAEAAVVQAGLDRVDLVVSRLALGKEASAGPCLDDRLAVLESVATSRPWLAVRLTDAQLVADIVEGYDVAILGADKWAQINDPAWYGGSVAARDAAVARLPRLLIAPRGSGSWRHELPGGGVEALGPGAEPARPGAESVGPGAEPVGRGTEPLKIASHHLSVSSTAARAGRREWMIPEAAAFDVETGAWSDGERYAGWRASRDHRTNH